MGTTPPPDDRDAEIAPDDLLEEPGPELDELDDLDDLTARTLGAAAGDDQIDTSRIPGIESGAGVAEGFEESEAQLIANATGFNDGGTERILEDAFPPEAESDEAVYGEADEEDVSEDE
jgi:hypothetical protein